MALVQLNQVIGTITPAGGAPVAVQSPCNCYIAKTYAASGELAARNQQLLSLMPVDAKPWIVAEINPAEGKKIGPDSVATVSVFGSRASYTGHVTSLESPLSDTGPDTGSANRPALMKIMLEQKLPVDFVNRLAAVTFAIH
jgi:hypothetical protein